MVYGGALFLWNIEDFIPEVILEPETVYRQMLYGSIMGRNAGQIINENESARLTNNGTVNSSGIIAQSDSTGNIPLKYGLNGKVKKFKVITEF